MKPPVFIEAMKGIEKENILDGNLYDPKEIFNEIQYKIKESLVSLYIFSVDKINVLCSSNNGKLFVAEVFFNNSEESIFMYDNGEKVIWF